MAGDPEVDDGTPVTLRTTARKTQIIVVVRPDGEAELEDGTFVPHRLLHQWLCDSAIGRVVMNADSVPIDVGRLSYTASDGQRRALKARDGGCIVPGCKRKARWCEAHHVNWWEHGGPTNVNNLVLVCKRHHKQVHKGTIKILHGDPVGTFVVTRGDGTPLLVRPPPKLIGV